MRLQRCLIWLLLGLLAAMPAQAGGLAGIWNVEIGAVPVEGNCALPAKLRTRHFGADTLYFVHRYRDLQIDGATISAQAPADLAALKDGPDAPPDAVFAAIQALKLETSFAGSLSADGKTLTGIDETYCFWWEGDRLTHHEILEVPITAHRVGIELSVLADPKHPNRVNLGSLFHLEIRFTAPVTWKTLTIWRVDHGLSLKIAASVTDDPTLLRTGPLYVLGASTSDTELEAEAVKGRLYAAEGERLDFGVYEASTHATVGGGPPLHLASPRVDEQDLQVARGLLDAEIDELDRQFAAAHAEIQQRAKMLEGLIEAAGLRNATLQRLDERRETLANQLAGLMIDRTALPAALQSLLSHRDYLERDRRRLEDAVLQAQARGDVAAREAALRSLQQVQTQLAEVDGRIAPLWAAVPESGDDTRPTTPAQLERARTALQAAIDALVPQIAEARARVGFDISAKARAEASQDAATAVLQALAPRLRALETKRDKLDRPFGYIQLLEASQDGAPRFRVRHEDLEALTALLADIDEALGWARADLGETAHLSWRLRQAFLRAVDAVAAQEASSYSASWNSLAKQLGVEVAAAGVELGVAAMTGGEAGLLVEAISKLAFNIADLVLDSHPFKNFDPGQLSALFVVAKDNAEMAYGARALLDEQDTLCRHADAAGGKATNLAHLEPALFPSGALFDRFGWPILRESLAMPVKLSATFALENVKLNERLQEGLIDQVARRQIRHNPAQWLESTVADFDALVAGEKLAREEVKAAEAALTQLKSWRRQMANAGIGLLVSAAVNISKQKLEDWIRSVEGEAYVTFFETQLAMSQAWRAYMGAVCLRWSAQDRVEQLSLIRRALVRAFDLDLGFVIETDKAIEPADELIVALTLSQDVAHPFGVLIAGVAGEALPGLRFRFPPGSLAHAARDQPLPVTVKVLRPPS